MTYTHSHTTGPLGRIRSSDSHGWHWSDPTPRTSQVAVAKKRQGALRVCIGAIGIHTCVHSTRRCNVHTDILVIIYVFTVLFYQFVKLLKEGSKLSKVGPFSIIAHEPTIIAARNTVNTTVAVFCLVNVILESYLRRPNCRKLHN